MEPIKNHEHRYLYHFEVMVVFLGLTLVGLGLYDSAFSQTGGWTTTDQNVDPSIRNANVSNVSNSNNSSDPQTYYNSSLDPRAYNASNVYPATNSGRNSTWWGNSTRGSSSGTGTTTGANTTGGTGYGTTGGGTGYYGTTGGVYYGQGVYDPNATRTQGGYVQTKGSGLYGNAGIVESGALRTQGTMIQGNGSGVFSGKYIDESLATPTQANTLNIKHCEFITKYHKFGDRGGDVPKIQQFLKDRGYYKGKIDGVYGITTFKAVRSFQKDYKDKILDPWEFNNKSAVEGTGITNVSTRYAINQMVGCPDPATIVPKTGKVLNY